MDHPIGHQQPRDDDPLFVPEEFEAEHREQARRMVQARSVPRNVGRRLAPWAAGQLSITPKQRLRSVIAALHAVAVLFAIVFSAVTGTWLIGVAVVALIGLSLWAVIRLLSFIAQVHAYEVAQR